jgi:hypothetical protein
MVGIVWKETLLLKTSRRQLQVLTVAWLLSLNLVAGAPQSSAPNPSSETLKSAVQDFVKSRAGNPDPASRYFEAFVDLDGDGRQEAIVYITGSSWCLAGACTTLVFGTQGSTYRIISRIIATRPPIRVLTTIENGWRTLTASSAGGQRYEAELPFDGIGYPSTTNQFPARQLIQQVEGEIVIPESASNSQTGKLLFP